MRCNTAIARLQYCDCKTTSRHTHLRLCHSQFDICVSVCVDELVTVRSSFALSDASEMFDALSTSFVTKQSMIVGGFSRRQGTMRQDSEVMCVHRMVQVVLASMPCTSMMVESGNDG